MMYSAPGRPRGRCFSPNESSHQARDTRAKLKASLGRRAATHLPFADLASHDGARLAVQHERPRKSRGAECTTDLRVGPLG